MFHVLSCRHRCRSRRHRIRILLSTRRLHIGPRSCTRTCTRGRTNSTAVVLGWSHCFCRSRCFTTHETRNAVDRYPRSAQPMWIVGVGCKSIVTTATDTRIYKADWESLNTNRKSRVVAVCVAWQWKTVAVFFSDKAGRKYNNKRCEWLRRQKPKDCKTAGSMLLEPSLEDESI